MKTKITVFISGLVALTGLLPVANEFYKSVVTSSPFGQSAIAIEQHKAWERNFDCHEIEKAKPINNSFGVEIKVSVCPSGDVLIVGKKLSENNPVFRWVTWETLVNPKAELSFMTEAVADPFVNESRGEVVLCQRWLNNGIIYRNVRRGRQCYDIWVNSYTGQIKDSRPARCKPC